LSWSSGGSDQRLLRRRGGGVQRKKSDAREPRRKGLEPAEKAWPNCLLATGGRTDDGL